jgi:hypothetical protein
MVYSFESRTIALEGRLTWPFSFCEETSGQGRCWSILKFANDDESYIQVLSVSRSLPPKKKLKVCGLTLYATGTMILV